MTMSVNASGNAAYGLGSTGYKEQISADPARAAPCVFKKSLWNYMFDMLAKGHLRFTSEEQVGNPNISHTAYHKWVNEATRSPAFRLVSPKRTACRL